VTHLVDEPEHALIIDEEAAAAVFITALDVFHSAQHLFHTAQAVANANTLGGKNRRAGIIGRAGTNGEQQLAAVIMAQPAVFLDFFLGMTEHTVGLGHAVDDDAVFGCGFQKGLHGFSRINSRNFNAESCAVRKTQGGRRHIE